MPSLYTWRDVERCLAREESPPWFEASADLETLTITCAPDRQREVREKVAQVFGSRLSPDGGLLELESTRDAPRHLTVLLDASEESGTSRRRVIRPLWPDAQEMPGAVEPLPSSPKVAAFYSYKGGVGRTTTLLATLGALLQLPRRSARVLVVDADLEAPGLTLEIPGPPDRFCLLDFLALVHDADDWRTEALPLAAERLRQNSQSLELSKGRVSFHFLPAYRDDDQLFAPPVTMEQVVRGRGRAYVMADALAALGQAVGVDVVLIDLRAGVTELSSPLMLDPRVQTILVTSCGTQSIEGTLQVLRRMKTRARPETSPEVVLSLIPDGFKPEDVAELSGKLKDAIPTATDDISEDVAQPNVHEAWFAAELLHFDSVQELLADLAPGTSLGKRVAPELASLLAPAEPAKAHDPRQSDPSLRLKAVAEEAKKLEYAEGNAQVGLLVTPALSALVENSDLPAAVVLGSKGAGKTFCWGQMVLARDFANFERIIAPAGRQMPPLPVPPALVFPLLSPSNMQPDLASKVREAEQTTWGKLGQGSEDAPTMTNDDLLAEIARGISQDVDELEFWTLRIAARLGLGKAAGASVEALGAALAERKVPICIVIDGLEDAFHPTPQTPLSSLQQRLLRGLLQRFTNKVRDMRSPYLGIVTFVRRDIAQGAIVQNFGQFEALHGRFSLVWTPTEALRLVAWLVDRAGLHLIESARIPLAPYDELHDALETFWGAQLGSTKSRGAHTDRWVIAALSDFQGRLQARDLVRLVRYAAESVADGLMLTPKALRNALAQCSRDKIAELKIEIPGLDPLFTRLQEESEDKKKVPFPREAFGLSPEEVSFLEAQGIVIRNEQGELYLPEIVRHGLGFRLEKGRRAKVLALYRAAQAKRPA